MTPICLMTSEIHAFRICLIIRILLRKRLSQINHENVSQKKGPYKKKTHNKPFTSNKCLKGILKIQEIKDGKETISPACVGAGCGEGMTVSAFVNTE